jgi:hypothetical protein
MTQVNIPLTEDQVDNIVINELKDALDMQLNLDTDEGGEYLEPDYQLIDAIKTVLSYYMFPSEAEKFMKEFALRELATQAQLDGQYK